MNIPLIIFFNFILSWSFTKLFIKPFRKLIPDIPNQRSSHKIIKPRGGGLSFILANLIGSYIFNQISFLFLLPLSLIGFIDDFFNISRFSRLFIQIATSSFILYSSKYINIIKSNGNFFIEFIFVVSIILICTGIINFCNFIDGIDGILSGSFITIYIFSTFLFSEPLWGITGALLGFLLWNWQPSKIFMGDSGSNFLGGTLIWILLNTRDINESIGLLFIASPIIVDPLICLIRRFFARKNIFEAHNMHLYQRLNKGGLNHQQVSLIYIFSIMFMGISFFIGGFTLEIISFLVILIFGLWLDIKYATPFQNE